MGHKLPLLANYLPLGATESCLDTCNKRGILRNTKHSQTVLRGSCIFASSAPNLDLTDASFREIAHRNKKTVFYFYDLGFP